MPLAGWVCRSSSWAGLRERTVRMRLVVKNMAARMMVARVSALPAPRADMKLPAPPPMPSAPPSERCKSTTPVRAMAMKMTMTDCGRRNTDPSSVSDR